MCEVIDNFFEEVKIKTRPKLISLSDKHNIKFVKNLRNNYIIIS